MLMVYILGGFAAVMVLAFLLHQPIEEWSAEKLSHFCPDFRIPPDDNKVYEVWAGRSHSFGDGPPRMSSGPHQGLREAYIEARRLGVKLEREESWRNPRFSAYADGSYPNSVGIYWAIKEITDE